MKKILCLILGFLLISGIAQAAERAVLVNGNGVEIGTDASPIYTQNSLSTAASHIADSGDQNALITGAATITNITVNGASAGDYATFYDKLTADTISTIFCEVYIGTNTSTVSVSYPGGVRVATGVSVDATDTDVNYIVTYDQ